MRSHRIDAMNRKYTNGDGTIWNIQSRTSMPFINSFILDSLYVFFFALSPLLTLFLVVLFTLFHVFVVVVAFSIPFCNIQCTYRAQRDISSQIKSILVALINEWIRSFATTATCSSNRRVAQWKAILKHFKNYVQNKHIWSASSE